jgi:bifunctional non-homologous end joining protein LigD
VKLTSLDRVLWPRAGFTKGDMVDYYMAVADTLLPHLAGRPITLGRWPQGVEGRGFAQTECRGRPSWMPTRRLTLADGREREFCLMEDRESLAWVANQSAIELHAFPWRRDPEHPAAVLLDLDPEAPGGLAECCRGALRLREALSARGLKAVVKGSGGRGLHVLFPLNSPCTWERARALARELSQELAGGPVSIDWRQNSPRLTTVAPYSLRAADLPTVSAPLTWGEVEAGAAGHPDRVRFLAADMPARLDALGDPFRPVLDLRQEL